MFQVKRILDGKIFDVFEVKDLFVTDIFGKIMFLIFEETEWKWVEAGYYEPYNNISSKIEKLEKIKKAAEDVTVSFECYMASNKPMAEWDEYDYGILPKWSILLKTLEDK